MNWRQVSFPTSRSGYNSLFVTLANTREPLFIANRSGNRPSHEYSAFYFDMAVRQCRGRRLVYRLFSFRPSVNDLLLIERNVHRPLRC